MRKEYDFSKGVRGKYAGRFTEGAVLILLEPDLVKAFPTAEAVNAALREVAEKREQPVVKDAG
jgi:hypothetical protein